MPDLEHVRSLLKLELRRQRPLLLRMVGMSAMTAAIFFMLGKRSPADQLAILLGTSLGIVALVPAGITRDKMEGTLEFLIGLPVEPRAIVISRFIATALTAIPWAVLAGFLALTFPPPFQMNPIGVCILAWMLFVLLGICGIAVMTRFELESLVGAPLIAMLIVFGLGPRLVHAVAPGLTAKSLLVLLFQPYAPIVIAFAMIAAIAGVGTLAFVVTERAIATYRRDSGVH